MRHEMKEVGLRIEEISHFLEIAVGGARAVCRRQKIQNEKQFEVLTPPTVKPPIRHRHRHYDQQLAPRALSPYPQL